MLDGFERISNVLMQWENNRIREGRDNKEMDSTRGIGFKENEDKEIEGVDTAEI